MSYRPTPSLCVTPPEGSTSGSQIKAVCLNPQTPHSKDKSSLGSGATPRRFAALENQEGVPVGRGGSWLVALDKYSINYFKFHQLL